MTKKEKHAKKMNSSEAFKFIDDIFLNDSSVDMFLQMLTTGKPTEGKTEETDWPKVGMDVVWGEMLTFGLCLSKYTIKMKEKEELFGLEGLQLKTH